MNGAPLLLLAAVAAAGATHRVASVPSAVLHRSGAVTVSLPPSILRSKEVQKQMTSGLTTAFVILAGSGETRGGARVSVRYELWDETYLVTVLDDSAQEQKMTFASADKLAEWWDATPLTTIRGGATSPRVEISIKVLPFSAREQAETQKWLSRVFTSMQSVKEAPVDKRGDPGAAKILDVLVSTSIQRRPILEFEWTVEAKQER